MIDISLNGKVRRRQDARDNAHHEEIRLTTPKSDWLYLELGTPFLVETSYSQRSSISVEFGVGRMLTLQTYGFVLQGWRG